MHKSYMRLVLENLLVIGACILGCRYTDGVFVIVIMTGCVVCILRKHMGMGAVLFSIPAFLAIMNRVILGLSTQLVIFSKIGTALFASVALCTPKRGTVKFPIGLLYCYLLVACVSSANGWFPTISYLKILNFTVVLFCLSCLVRAIQSNISSLLQARAVIMAFAVIMILGSALTYFIPSVGYSMNFRIADLMGVIMTDEDVMAEGFGLFNGMTYHSQALGAIAAIFSVWVIADMLFVERRIVFLHCILIALSPFLLYVTRSRTAIATLLGSFVMILICLSHAKLPIQILGRVRKLFFFIFSICLLLGIVAEVKDARLTKWLRKTDDISTDGRSLSEAFTSSRQGAVERNLYDFKLNPLLGMGFQVIAEHKQAYKAGMISLVSAPIEKGILPLMILGETGIVGVLVFLAFVIRFFHFCIKRQYFVSAISMAAFFSSNIGEAFFFSPTATGGLVWVVVAIGGFSCDLLAKCQNEYPWHYPTNTLR